MNLIVLKVPRVAVFDTPRFVTGNGGQVSSERQILSVNQYLARTGHCSKVTGNSRILSGDFERTLGQGGGCPRLVWLQIQVHAKNDSAQVRV